MKTLRNLIAGTVLAASALLTSSALAEPVKSATTYALLSMQTTTMSFLPASFENNGNTAQGWYVIYDAMDESLSYGLTDFHCSTNTVRVIRIDRLTAEGSTSIPVNQIIEVKPGSNLDVAKKLSCNRASPASLDVLVVDGDGIMAAISLTNESAFDATT